MGRMRFYLGGNRKRGGFVLSLVLGALLISSFLVVLSGCTTELIETIDKMVDFYNRTDKDAPVVIFTTPTHGDLTVALNTKITVTFDEYMDPETINNSTFRVNDGTRDVKGTVSYIDEFKMAVFTPSVDLISTYQYQIKLTREIRDKIGNRLEEYAWSFKADAVDGTAPTIVSRYPEDLATEVSPNVNVTVTFSEPLDPLSIGGSSFMLYEGPVAGVNPISGKVAYNDASNTLIFVPAVNLKNSTVYTAQVLGGVSDLAGISISAADTWSFTVGTEIDKDPPGVVDYDPGYGDIDVGIAEEIWIDFDEPMNPETINNKTFSMETGSGPVAGVVVYDPKPVMPDRYRASFIPKDKMKYMTQYYVAVSGAVEDMSGNQLGSGKSWTFATLSSDTATTSIEVDVGDAEYSSGLITAYVNIANQYFDIVGKLLLLHITLEENVAGGGFEEVPSKALTLARYPKGKSVAILVDTSKSIDKLPLKGYKEILHRLVEDERSFRRFDKAEFITFTGDEATPNIKVFPPFGFTSDRDVLHEAIDKLALEATEFMYLFEGVGTGLVDLYNQSGDMMRGRSGVISFTDAFPDPRYLIEGPTFGLKECVEFAQKYEMPVPSITFGEANDYEPLVELGKKTPGSTEGFYMPTRNLDEIAEAHFRAMDYMESLVPKLYTLSWKTKGESGDSVEVRVTVEYWTVNDLFEDFSPGTFTVVIP